MRVEKNISLSHVHFFLPLYRGVFSRRQGRQGDSNFFSKNKRKIEVFFNFIKHYFAYGIYKRRHELKIVSISLANPADLPLPCQ
jgi:hypothetical protein